jgi:predicted amidohydrolase YtcJ
MLTLRYTRQFQRDLKRRLKRGTDPEKLKPFLALPVAQGSDNWLMTRAGRRTTINLSSYSWGTASGAMHQGGDCMRLEAVDDVSCKTISRRSLLTGTAALGGVLLLSGCRPVSAVRSVAPVVAASASLFTNGAIYIDAARTVTNLLVSGGGVQGWNVDPAEHPQAAVVDLAGAALYPGFIDSHVHLESAYFFQMGANLFGATDAASIAAAVEKTNAAHPERTFIIGFGFAPRDYDQWSLADLAVIDAVTGDKPAFLVDYLGHNAIANTALIKLADISAETPVPFGSKMGIEDGQLTGMMRESAMLLPSQALLTLFDDADIKTALHGALQRWASIGYTGCIDMMGGPGFRFMKPEIFWALEQEGKLPVRTHYCYTIFNLSDVDAALAYVGKDTPLTHFVGCKLFVDGAYAAGQAWTSWPHEQGDYGLPQVYTDDRGGPELNINRIVAKVEEYGLNIHYHTQGDMAIGAVLDALDQVVAENGRLRGIHTLIHLAFPTEDQIERIARFGGNVVTTMQPGFWEVEAGTDFYYGERADQAYPLKQLIDAGASVGMSTDWSVSPAQYAPAAAVIGVAVTGAGNPEVHTPLTVQELVHGFTVGSAATTGQQDIGRLEAGHKADMVLFDRSLDSVAPSAFSAENPRVLATYVAGVQMYAAA